MLSLRISSCKDVQDKKKHLGMTVSLLGRVTVFNFSQEEKTLSPIFTALLGIIILVKF